jgi:hypothetical protein
MRGSKARRRHSDSPPPGPPSGPAQNSGHVPSLRCGQRPWMVKAKPRGGACVQRWSLQKVGGYWLYWVVVAWCLAGQGRGCLVRCARSWGGRCGRANARAVFRVRRDAPNEEKKVKVAVVPAQACLRRVRRLLLRRLLLEEGPAAQGRRRERARRGDHEEEHEEEHEKDRPGASALRRARTPRPGTIGHRSAIEKGDRSPASLAVGWQRRVRGDFGARARGRACLVFSRGDRERRDPRAREALRESRRCAFTNRELRGRAD